MQQQYDNTTDSSARRAISKAMAELQQELNSNRNTANAYRIGQHNGVDAVFIDEYVTDKAPAGVDDRSFIKAELIKRWKNKPITLREIDANAMVGNKSYGKLAGKSYSGQPHADVEAKVNSAMYMDELGATVSNMRKDTTNTKSHQKNAPQFMCGDITIISRGRPFAGELVIKHGADGANRIHDILIKQEIPPSQGSVSAAANVFRQYSTDNIANYPRIVNNKRFRISDIDRLQAQIDDIQNNPKPRMTKELREAIDGVIYESHPQLFEDYANLDIIGENGSDWGIPRLLPPPEEGRGPCNTPPTHKTSIKTLIILRVHRLVAFK